MTLQDRKDPRLQPISPSTPASSARCDGQRLVVDLILLECRDEPEPRRTKPIGIDDLACSVNGSGSICASNSWVMASLKSLARPWLVTYETTNRLLHVLFHLVLVHASDLNGRRQVSHPGQRGTISGDHDDLGYPSHQIGPVDRLAALKKMFWMR